MYNLTDLAQVAIKNATIVASKQGYIVGTEHILYGLSSVSESKASKLLSSFGVKEEELYGILMSNQESMQISNSLEYTPRTKKLFAIALAVTTILPISCGHKTATTADDADSTLTADETVKQGIIQMEKSEVTDTTTWRGALYTYTVNRMPDPHLD